MFTHKLHENPNLKDKTKLDLRRHIFASIFKIKISPIIFFLRIFTIAN